MEKKRCYGCMRPKGSEPFCEHCGYDERSGNAPHQLPAGTVLREQYLVGRVLGQGGFGITYLGWDLYLDIPVAIKEYFPTGMVMREASQTFSVVNCLDDDGDRFHNNRDRFMREAKMLARFAYVPEIVQIKNFFLANNTAYIVMEYVQGITLKEYIRRRGGTLAIQEALAILRPIMVGLSKLHKAGIIHRDISPDNIMMLPGGGAKLLDFGAVRDVGSTQVDKEISRSTDAILKQGYAPIEQYQQRGALGPWSDVYALCATVYYCLTGTVPPDSPARMLEEEKLTFAPGIELDKRQLRALTRGMAIRAADRPRNMEELYQELFGMPIPQDEDDQQGDFQTDYTDPEPPKEKKKKGWILPVVAILLIVGGLAAWFLTRPKEGRLSDRIPTHPTTQVTEESVPETEQTEPVRIQEPTQPPRPVVQDPLENTLMEHMVEDSETGSSTRAFGMVVTRDMVRSITVLPTVSGAPKTAADVSMNHNGKVLGWVEKNGELYDLYLAAEGGVYAPANSKHLFAFFTNVQTINFNDAFFTDNVENGGCMFYKNSNLTQLDVSGFDTSNMTSMQLMFSGCEMLPELDVSGFDTSKVTTMYGMFQSCKAVEHLDVSGFDTSKTTDFGYMFNNCMVLTELDVSGFDTRNAESMKYMFRECAVLKELDVSGFNTAKVNNMERMFAGCGGLEELDVSGFSTAQVTNMEYMFSRCTGVKNLDVSGFNTVSVTSMRCMFDECRSLKVLDVSGFNTVNVTSMRGMFEDCNNVRALDVSGFNTEKVTDLSYMFNGCYCLENLDVSGFNTSNVLEMYATFRECRALTTLDVSSFNTSNVTYTGRMFEKSAALTELDLRNFDTSKVNDMELMFSGCSGLKSINLTGFVTNEVTDMQDMFSGCSGLESLDLSGFNTGKVTNMSNMFYGCSSLTDLKLGSFNTSKVTNHENFMEEGKKINGKDWTTLFS